MIDLLDSRLSNQIAKCFAWKPGLHSLPTDAMRQEWNQKILPEFTPKFISSESLLKNSKGERQYSNINNSRMESSTLVSKSSCKVIFSTFSTPNVSRYSEELEKRRGQFGKKKQIFSTSWLEGY